MIDLDQFPREMREKVREDVNKHGEWVISSYVYMAPLWRMISELKETDPDISWMITVMHLINFFATKDPLPMHYVISRDILKTKKISENKAVDMLARELVGSCQKFKQFVEKEFSKEGGMPFPLQDEKGYLVPESNQWEGFTCEKDGCNKIDFLFSNFLESQFSKTGKNASKAILEDSRKRLQYFIDSNSEASKRPIIWNNWINSKNGKTTIFSPFLSLLSDVIWEDVFASQWIRKEKNVPALTRSIHPKITKILSPKSETKMIDNQFYMLHDGRIIATLPTIDPGLISVVTKGAAKLNSIYHHKLLRFQCKTGFENWIHKKPDARVLRFERGCSEIAEILHLESNRAIEEIKALLNAQAYMNFSFEDGSNGNLISLRKFRSKGCNRDDGIEIILGTQLLPHYTFQASKRDRLLIPVPEFPPLVSAPQYHAGQSLLQMMVMEEFSENSIEFSEYGSISITKKRWVEFSKEVGLPASVFKKTLDRWVQDGDDGAKFLIKIDADRYTLGPSFNKEADFLKHQGVLRKQRQKDGKKSVIAKKRKRKKGS